jgi:pyruvate kinase
MKVPYNKTKIICTIGPSSSGEKVLKKLMYEGMDIARFDLSHSTPQAHLKIINKVRKIASKDGLPVGIMVDLPGVKLRIGIGLT